MENDRNLNLQIYSTVRGPRVPAKIVTYKAKSDSSTWKRRVASGARLVIDPYESFDRWNKCVGTMTALGCLTAMLFGIVIHYFLEGRPMTTVEIVCFGAHQLALVYALIVCLRERSRKYRGR